MKKILPIVFSGLLVSNAFAVDAPKATDQSKAQGHANSHVQKRVTEKRKEIIQDATVAMNQTKEALKMLDEGNRKGAINALESATGKLEVIVARDPKLSLAAFDYNVTASTLLNDLKSVKNLKEEAEDLIEDDRVQEASAILANLKSEIVISVANIPLATYPTAMKEAARLIDQNKIDDAKNVIAGALGTIVLTNTIIPLPVARAEYLLSEAEKLSSKKERTKAENKRLNNLMEESRNELKLAEELGYGEKSDFKKLYAQLDDVLKKSEGGKSGEGWFADIKNSISGMISDRKDNSKQAQEESK